MTHPWAYVPLVESGHPFQTFAPMRFLFTSKIVEHSRHLPAALNHPKLPRALRA